MLALGTFLAGPLGKLVEWAVGILFIIGCLVGVYFTIVHNASQNQLLKDQAKISDQIIKNQEEYLKKTEDLMRLQQSSQVELQKKIDEIKDNTNDINAYLNNPDTVKNDRPASDVLKETIKRLSGEK